MCRVLKYAVAALMLGCALLAASAQSSTCPSRPVPGTLVLNPLELSSKNGELQLGLTIRNGADSLGYMHYCFEYSTSSGTVEAPTLRMNPGDTLTLDLINQLNVPHPTADERLPRMEEMEGMNSAGHAAVTDPCQSKIMNFNTTNVHFHGLNVPPVCHQDDVLNTLIQPSKTPFRYQIKIPENEPPGLYWYHPHPHGFTTFQVNGGAAGAIIIGGMERIKPQVAGLTERVFMIRQQFLKPGAWIPGPFQFSLNFQPAISPAAKAPIIQMKPGEKQFWRVANASTQAFLALQLLFGTTAQTLELIAIDGVPVTGNPMVDTINLPPAGRAEFIVTGPPAGAAASFVTAGFDTGPIGNANAFQLLADVVSTSDPTGGPAAGVPAAVPALPVEQRFSGLAAIKPTTQRKLYFAEAAQGTNPPLSFFITVEGQPPRIFKADEPPAIVTHVGAVEDWTIENRTSEEHAFHMHQIHFLVIAIDGKPLSNPTMRDTVNVHFWDGKGPYHNVTVRMDFRDPNIAGTFVYHCHVLAHEDSGMMAKIQVDP
jgi:FtsP/CotA-like multicopper oxidase with cupredoxin domain